MQQAGLDQVSYGALYRIALSEVAVVASELQGDLIAAEDCRVMSEDVLEDRRLDLPVLGLGVADVVPFLH